MTTPTIRFVADRGDSHLRLDQVLVRRATEVSRMSRTRAHSWIEDGRVAVDGVPIVRASAKVREGAGVVVTLPTATSLRESPRAEPLPLDVLYEDDHLLAVIKPAGMVVHPSFRNASGTILNAVLWRYRDRLDVRPGLINRLDKDTSGVLLLALSPGVHATIQRDARAGRVRKEYIAVVRGTLRPSHGVIALSLAHDPSDRRRIIVSNEGMPSETRYRVVSSHGDCSVVACELVTGRTHQIRVHLAASGAPIVGDPTYGVTDVRIGRQALHAWRMTLPHPARREALHIEAPVPADMKLLTGEITAPSGHDPAAHGSSSSHGGKGSSS